ncbi:MAG: hypothetical protein WB919_22270 [Candidatus Sulfotelmatobacter sp.]
MRYPAAIALFLLLPLSMPLQAQRGGGHAAGGGHGGFSGHSSFGGHAFAGARSGSSFASHSFARSPSSLGRSSFGRPPLNRSFSAPLSSRVTSRNFNRSTGLRIRTRGFRNNCFGFPCGWGYGYPYLGGGVDPYWWGDNDSSYDQDEQDQIGLANEMNAQSLDEQQMRQQGDRDLYARQAPLPPRVPERSELATPTVLVFHDHSTQEVNNYAIVGQTLWNFAPQHTQKIPLSDLDLSATTKANEDRGVDFRVPTVQGTLTLEYHSVDN